MNRLLSRFALACAAALLLPAAAGGAPLITPAELAARLAEPGLRVIDIRAGTDNAGRTPYEVGHIAGSLPAPYPTWRGPADNPGALPAAAALAQRLQSLGIGADTPVVIVYEGRDATDFGAAARVYWTLKAHGVRQPSILNGGVRAWQDAGQSLVTGAAPAVTPSDFVPQPDPRLIATRDDVQQALQHGRSLLLDARSARYFRGETRHAAAARPGTIAGSRNVDNAVWFAADSATLLAPAAVKEIATAQGIDTTQPTVSFCNTGHWAATNWFVLSEVLGQQNVSLYPASLVEWSRTGGAMDNVPGRLVQFWLQLKEATGTL